MRNFLVAMALGAMSLVTLTAGAQAADNVVVKLSPEQVSKALDAYELQYEVQRDNSGDPLIIVRAGNLVHDQGMAVIFYGCDEQNMCDTVTLYTFFRTASPLDAEIYHIWNDIFRIRTWTKAFKDTDGDTGMVLNVNAIGGVGVESFEFMVGVFLTEMNAFKTALEGAASGSYTSADLNTLDNWTSVFNDTFGTMAIKDADSGDFPLAERPAPKALMGQD